MRHILKTFDSGDLLEKIPISDIVEYYGISKIVQQIGAEDLLSYIKDHCEEEFNLFIKKIK